MLLSKFFEPVTITPHNSIEKAFELYQSFSTPSFNNSAANFFDFNQVCDAINSVHHFQFPSKTVDKIRALLGVNALAFTYPTLVFPGNKNLSDGVKFSFSWAFKGEYEIYFSRQTE